MTRKSQKNKLILAVVFILSAIAFGCKKEQPSPAPVAGVVPKPKTVVQKPVSTVKLTPAPANQFDFSKKKDPFKPFIAVKAEVVGPKKNDSPKLPLHSFDISQFRLIGVVADVKGNKAMVVDPSGKGYVLRVGMSIGKNEARITRIATTGIEAVEQFRDENGKIRKENIKIPLMRKP